MKRSASNATLFAYIGAVVLIASYYPAWNATLDRIPLLHALWHVATFVGAALLIYGLETLRRLARKSRRISM